MAAEPSMHREAPTLMQAQGASYIFGEIFRDLYKGDAPSEMVQNLDAEVIVDQRLQELREIQEQRDSVYRLAQSLEQELSNTEQEIKFVDDVAAQALKKTDDDDDPTDTELPKPPKVQNPMPVVEGARRYTLPTVSSTQRQTDRPVQQPRSQRTQVKPKPPSQMPNTARSTTKRPNVKHQSMTTKAAQPPKSHLASTKGRIGDKAFQAQPKEIIFDEYIPGKVYEMKLVLTNCSGSTRKLRITPPAHSAFSVDRLSLPKVATNKTTNLAATTAEAATGSFTTVAAGLSATTIVRFAPTSAGDVHDQINVVTDGDALPMVISIRGHHPPPQLYIPEVVDCGPVLLGSSTNLPFSTKNEGGTAKFTLLPLSDGDSPFTEDEASQFWVEHTPENDTVSNGPFSISPATLTCPKGKKFELSITMQPESIGEYQTKFQAVSNTGKVFVLPLRGNCQIPSVDITLGSTNRTCYDAPGRPKSLILDSRHPCTPSSASVNLSNNTAVDLSYTWKLFQEPATSEETLVPLEQSPFTFSPSSGCLEAAGNSSVTIEFSSNQTGIHSALAQLVCVDVPDATKPNTSHDAVMGEIILTAECLPLKVSLVPSLLDLSVPIPCCDNIRRPVTIKNDSDTSISYSFASEMALPHASLQIVPPTGKVGANSSRVVELLVETRHAGAFSRELTCSIDDGQDLSLQVEGVVAEPRVVIDVPFVDFGLLSLQDKRSFEIPIRNYEEYPLSWSIQPVDDLGVASQEMQNMFHFSVDHGEIPAYGSAMVVATIYPQKIQHFQGFFSVLVEHGSVPNVVGVSAVVMARKACFTEPAITLNDACVGQRQTGTLELMNLTNLPTKFKLQLIGTTSEVSGKAVLLPLDNFTGDVMVSPMEGNLHPGGRLPIEVTMAPNTIGQSPYVLIACMLEHEAEPICAAVCVQSKGLDLQCRLLSENEEDNEIKPLAMIDFGEIPAGQVTSTSIELTNNSGVPLLLNTDIAAFKTVESSSTMKQPASLAPATSHAVTINTVKSGKLGDSNAPTITPKMALGRNLGLAFHVTADCAVLPPFSSSIITIDCFSNTWGSYTDCLKVTCVNQELTSVKEEIYLPIVAKVVGSPLVAVLSGEGEQSTLLRFPATMCRSSNGTSDEEKKSQRKLTVKNRSCLPITVDWTTFNISENDDALVDVLVSYSPDDTVGIRTREHKGAESGRPFQCIQPQSEIRSGTSASVDIQFTPTASEDFHGFARATTVVKDEQKFYQPKIHFEVPEKFPRPCVNRDEPVAEKIALDVLLTGIGLIPKLLPTCGQSEFHLTAPADMIKKDAPLMSETARRRLDNLNDLAEAENTSRETVVFLNTTPAQLAFSYQCPLPFKIKGLKRSTTVSGGERLVLVQPGASVNVTLSLASSDEVSDLLSQSAADDVKDPNESITISREAITVRRDLIFRYQGGVVQRFPLVGKIARPILTLSKTNLDFGSTVVGATKTLSVILSNVGQCGCGWKITTPEEKGFSVEPSQGNIPAQLTKVADNKIELTVTFTPKGVGRYSETITLKGQASLGQGDLALLVEGDATYDENHK